MVLVVPVGDNLGDIRKLEDVGGNLFDEINTAFEKQYANEFEKKWGRPDLTLTMPMFRQVLNYITHFWLKINDLSYFQG